MPTTANPPKADRGAVGNVPHRLGKARENLAFHDVRAPRSRAPAAIIAQTPAALRNALTFFRFGMSGLNPPIKSAGGNSGSSGPDEADSNEAPGRRRAGVGDRGSPPGHGLGRRAATSAGQRLACAGRRSARGRVARRQYLARAWRSGRGRRLARKSSLA